MKLEHIQRHHTDTPIPRLSDEEVEARVFCNLQAQQRAREEEGSGSILIMQYPDTRTLFQRFAAWWHLRLLRRKAAEPLIETKTFKEPDWPRHWSTTKYL